MQKQKAIPVYEIKPRRRSWIVNLLIVLVIGAGAGFVWLNYQPKAEAVQYVPVSNTENYIKALRPDIDPVIRSEIAKAIDNECMSQGLDPELVVAIIARESSFVPWATSQKDCVGLMQANPKAHPALCSPYARYELYHIAPNVRIGCQILKTYISSSSTVREALGKYVGSQKHKIYINGVLSTAAELYAMRGLAQ